MTLFQGSAWDWALLAVAGYLAVLALVRLMLAERNRLGQELDAQITAEQHRLAVEKLKAEKERRQREMQEDYDKQRKRAA